MTGSKQCSCAHALQEQSLGLLYPHKHQWFSEQHRGLFPTARCPGLRVYLIEGPLLPSEFPLLVISTSPSGSPSICPGPDQIASPCHSPSDDMWVFLYNRSYRRAVLPVSGSFPARVASHVVFDLFVKGGWACSPVSLWLCLHFPDD